MGATVRVKLSKAVRTFPLPAPLAEGWHPSPWPDAARTWCLRQRCGYTELFNLISDPARSDRDTQHMREALAECDSQALRAYGWQDVPVRHDFLRTRFGVRYRLASTARTEVLRRLLHLNLQRGAQLARSEGLISDKIGVQQRQLFPNDPED